MYAADGEFLALTNARPKSSAYRLSARPNPIADKRQADLGGSRGQRMTRNTPRMKGWTRQKYV